MTSTIGMLIFWTLQSVCVSLYAQDNSRKGAAHTVIAMICKSLCNNSFALDADANLPFSVLFYGFCKYLLLFIITGL